MKLSQVHKWLLSWRQVTEQWAARRGDAGISYSILWTQAACMHCTQNIHILSLIRWWKTYPSHYCKNCCAFQNIPNGFSSSARTHGHVKNSKQKGSFIPTTQLKNSRFLWYRAFLRSQRLSCFVFLEPLNKMIIDSFCPVRNQMHGWFLENNCLSKGRQQCWTPRNAFDGFSF